MTEFNDIISDVRPSVTTKLMDYMQARQDGNCQRATDIILGDLTHCEGARMITVLANCIENLFEMYFETEQAHQTCGHDGEDMPDRDEGWRTVLRCIEQHIDMMEHECKSGMHDPKERDCDE